MKTVKIRKMTLHYFKGVKSREVEFGEEQTEVIGPNGCGKSTLMDAFFWCLWGKNAAGQSDTKFGIKTNDAEGKEIPHVDHEVKMHLTVDGLEMTFRRVMTPKYDKEDNLTGNTTAYYWNDVPMKQSEYNKKVADVISEDVFKLITSPYAFLSLPWEKQRDMLMRMAGDVSDADVARGNDELTSLLARITGKSLEEYKREVANKLKRVDDAMKDIPARIDEVLRSMPAKPDVEALDGQKVAIQEEIESLDRAQRDEAEKINMLNADRNALAKKISNAKWEQHQILMAAESAERNSIHEANIKHDEAEREMSSLDMRLSQAEQKRNSIMEECEKESLYIKQEKEKADKDLEDLREKWMKVNAQTFQAEDYLKCPLYGHTCNDGHACAKYDENQGAAYEKWEAAKKAELEATQTRGQQMKTRREQMDLQSLVVSKKAEEVEQKFKSFCEEIQQKKAEIGKQLAASPRKPLVATVKGTDIPEWVSKGKEIDDMEQQLNGMLIHEAPDQSEYTRKKKELIDALARVNSELSAMAIIERSNKRISELEEDNRKLGAQKAELEYERSTINAFEIAKTEMVGSKVNGMFKIVRWQMFQRQVNGEEVPACICMCGAARYNDVNKAGKINAGIDIASALMSAYQVSAPMFIDEAESSGNIYNPHTSQRIILRFDRNTQDMITLNK